MFNQSINQSYLTSGHTNTNQSINQSYLTLGTRTPLVFNTGYVAKLNLYERPMALGRHHPTLFLVLTEATRDRFYRSGFAARSQDFHKESTLVYTMPTHFISCVINVMCHIFYHILSEICAINGRCAYL